MMVKVWRDVQNTDECNVTLEDVKEWYQSGSYTVFELHDGSKRLLRTKTIYEFEEAE